MSNGPPLSSGTKWRPPARWMLFRFITTRDAAICKKRGVTFRLHRQGDRHSLIVKVYNGGYPSGLEWEHPVTADTPDFAALKGTCFDPVFDKTVRRGLKPLFEIRMRRTFAPLQFVAAAAALRWGLNYSP